MKKILVLGIFILLSSVLAEALECLVCDTFDMRKGCVNGQGSCTAGPTQKCMKVESFLGHVKGTISQGCTQASDICDIFHLDPQYGSVKAECCSDRDNCNAVAIPKTGSAAQ